MNHEIIFEIEKLQTLGYHKSAMEMALEYIETLHEKIEELEPEEKV